MLEELNRVGRQVLNLLARMGALEEEVAQKNASIQTLTEQNAELAKKVVEPEKPSTVAKMERKVG